MDIKSILESAAMVIERHAEDDHEIAVMESCRAVAEAMGEPVAKVIFGTNGQLKGEVLNQRAVSEGDKLYLAPPAPVVPGTKEWKLVPVEPTDNMIAGLVGPSGYCSIPLCDAYRAMLEAAPEPGTETDQ